VEKKRMTMGRQKSDEEGKKEQKQRTGRKEKSYSQSGFEIYVRHIMLEHAIAF
jgi:hypothetical protein